MDHLIIRPCYPSDWPRLMAIHDAARMQELRLAGLEDAFLPDNRLLGIKDYTYTFEDTSLSAAFTVLTVFGDVPGSMEVTLA